MKKRTKVSLIAAAALFLIGVMFLSLGFSFVEKWEDVSMQAEKTYVVTEPFTSIQIDSTVCDVTVVKTDEEFRAICPDSDEFSYAVTVEENTLHIRQVDLRRWYDFIGIQLGKTEIKVYLPESYYDLLRIDTDTGDIYVPEDFSFSTAEIFTDTGDVTFFAAVSERINAGASTGDFTFCGSNPNQVHVRTSTGSVSLENISCRDCFVKTTTGDLFISSLTCQTLECQSDTGNKQLQNVAAEEYIKAISTTGDVALTGCDGLTITIETDTGDITGTLLSPKEFFVQTDTGETHLPDHSGTANGKCYVNSSTGDITFTYQP